MEFQWITVGSKVKKQLSFYMDTSYYYYGGSLWTGGVQDNVQNGLRNKFLKETGENHEKCQRSLNIRR